MSMQDLIGIAQTLVAPGKGILALDESTPTCGKRFAAEGIENTETNRRDYREMLLTAPGLGNYVSGAILYDETLRMRGRDGTPFADFMNRNGILPGIKVDTGAKDLAGHPGETVTEGLDGLRNRLAEYRALGARFCKWRAVITITPALPSVACIDANTHALARYAALCQEAGLVPIVEPEVLLDGDHTLERCYAVTVQTHSELFAQLRRQGVALEGLLLKPSMVLPGKACAKQASVADVATATLRCLRNAVPAAVAGVAFLSGGQSDEAATAHLNEMNVQAAGTLPWPLTFSYARALQAPALRTWRGRAENVAAAQKVLAHRAACNSAAAHGHYSVALEKDFIA